jgi:teichuronic acid biosynthesis glycosyltransferase TuaC
MKVLFVCSGDKKGEPKVVVRNQGASLGSTGIDVSYFCVRGRGIISYLKAIPALKRNYQSLRPDIVHAHYSYSGFLTFLAGARPLVISFMGSDAVKSGLIRFLTRLLANHFCCLAIVKSLEMKRSLKLKRAEIIPNGVDTVLFDEKERLESCKRTGMDPSAKNILFIGDPERKEKNFNLALKAVETAGKNDIKLIALKDIPNTELSWYYNAADLLLLTSLWEGSPNVVKEAMACNLPVVATRVGDIVSLLDGVRNSYICTHDPPEIGRLIKEAIVERKRSDGREKIFRAGLDANTIALKIKSEYIKILAFN